MPSLRYGDKSVRRSRRSAEIVGVGLDLKPHGRGGDDMIIEAVLVAVGDCGLPRSESHPHLRVGVAGPVPPRQRVGAKRLLPLELQDPLSRVRIAGLGGLRTCSRIRATVMGPQVAKCVVRIKTRASSSASVQPMPGRPAKDVWDSARACPSRHRASFRPRSREDPSSSGSVGQPAT